MQDKMPDACQIFKHLPNAANRRHCLGSSEQVNNIKRTLMHIARDTLTQPSITFCMARSRKQDHALKAYKEDSHQNTPKWKEIEHVEYTTLLTIVYIIHMPYACAYTKAYAAYAHDIYTTPAQMCLPSFTVHIYSHVDVHHDSSLPWRPVQSNEAQCTCGILWTQCRTRMFVHGKVQNSGFHNINNPLLVLHPTTFKHVLHLGLPMSSHWKIWKQHASRTTVTRDKEIENRETKQDKVWFETRNHVVSKPGGSKLVSTCFNMNEVSGQTFMFTPSLQLRGWFLESTSMLLKILSNISCGAVNGLV